jgi:AraC-like DNA-binding protein
MSRHLRHLHAAAIGAIESRSTALIGVEAAHGLEQQLIGALVECLSQGSASEAVSVTRQHQDVAVRFEALLQTQPDRSLRVAEICAALGVSARTLRMCCEEQLGMDATEYVRLRRMHLVHRALSNGNADAASISAVARRCGFRGLGRFAVKYRALFGELPSATLRRSLHPGMAHLVLRRPRGRV